MFEMASLKAMSIGRFDRGSIAQGLVSIQLIHPVMIVNKKQLIAWTDNPLQTVVDAKLFTEIIPLNERIDGQKRSEIEADIEPQKMGLKFPFS